MDRLGVLAMDAGEFWGFTAFALFVCISSFIRGFTRIRRARRVENTPTSRIRSASQGYVELEGQCYMPSPRRLVAPLSGTPCVWYRYRIQKKRKKHWHTVKSGVSSAAFVLEDDTGQCVIYPAGATVIVGHTQTWYGPGMFPSTDQIEFGIGGGNYRYTEERLHDDDHVIALGHFHTRKTASGESESDIPLNTLVRPDTSGLPYIISSHPQDKLISRSRWSGWSGILMFFISGAFAVHMLVSRLM